MERQNIIKYYIKTLSRSGSILPIAVDRQTALTLVREISGEDIVDLGECRTGQIKNISLYQKNEEKKSLSIEDIRQFLREVHEKPYEGKTISLICDIDTASLEAMNSLLKILEEPPEHSAIILVVENPEYLLDTVRSRILVFPHEESTREVDGTQQNMLEEYFKGNKHPLISFLYSSKMDEPESINLLTAGISLAHGDMLKRIEDGLVELFGINESPRNILDKVFLPELPPRA